MRWALGMTSRFRVCGKSWGAGRHCDLLNGSRGKRGVATALRSRSLTSLNDDSIAGACDALRRCRRSIMLDFVIPTGSTTPRNSSSDPSSARLVRLASAANELRKSTADGRRRISGVASGVDGAICFTHGCRRMSRAEMRDSSGTSIRPIRSLAAPEIVAHRSLMKVRWPSVISSCRFSRHRQQWSPSRHPHVSKPHSPASKGASPESMM
mmetsp:Transcript_16459/g.48474  ORF Transcript_16459/g.48474 Transcript_16459/m.48474 type:complete len:210 (-) Transcript_16459:948-1577(-)